MLTASILGLRYCRLLTSQLTPEKGKQLAADFDYIFAVCHGNCEAPNFDIVQKNACLIDLSNGAEIAFSKFHATSRNEVRRSDKFENLSFQMGTGNDFDAYFNFYKACENARGWFPVPEEELRNSLIFTALFDGQPVSGISVYTNETRLRIGRIFSLKKTRRDARLNNLVYGCAAKRLVLECCQYGAENGFQTLDLGGIDLQDPAKAGITQFKLSLGGQVAPVTIARFANARFRDSASQIRESGYDIT